jgi:hypothetical protein
MLGIRPDLVKDTSIEFALPLWKNYSTLSPSLRKVSKGAGALLDWVTSVVEWKLKNETMRNLQ